VIYLPKQFFEGRNPPQCHPESLESIEFWDEQIDRCLDGYEYDGYSVTGDHYFFLNFYKMDMLKANHEPDFNHPYISQEDEKLFKLLLEAKLSFLGFMFITGRGYGKSHIVSAMACNAYTLQPRSHTIISASYEKPAKDLYEKVSNGLYALPQALKHNRLVNNPGMIESGIKYKDQYGMENVKGFRSKLERVIYEDSPGKTRGSRPTMQIFEEVGAWTGSAKLIDCYNMSLGSFYRGSVKTCFPVLIGTGGQMLSGGSTDASIMFKDPKAFGLMAFQESDLKKPTCYFIPTYKKLTGFYEETGISDEVGARASREKIRLEKTDNQKSYNQEVQEYPFEHTEAFMLSGSEYLRYQADLQTPG
jgi:hypothetical protein